MRTYIKIDYYKGAYGPTIIMKIDSEESIEYVKDIFINLSHGNIHESSFDGTSFITLHGIDEFKLRLIPEDRHKSVEINRSVNTKTIVNWCNTREKWNDCAKLLEGIKDTPIPSHQYLSEEGVDDAVIIISYKE